MDALMQAVGRIAGALGNAVVDGVKFLGRMVGIGESEGAKAKEHLKGEGSTDGFPSEFLALKDREIEEARNQSSEEAHRGFVEDIFNGEKGIKGVEQQVRDDLELLNSNLFPGRQMSVGATHTLKEKVSNFAVSAKFFIDKSFPDGEEKRAKLAEVDAFVKVFEARADKMQDGHTYSDVANHEELVSGMYNTLGINQ